MDRSQLLNRFEFVALASARARQLLDGCTPKIATGEKPARAAQHEVSAGFVQRVGEPAASGRAPSKN